jgi:hypothetical protein
MMTLSIWTRLALATVSVAPLILFAAHAYLRGRCSRL